MPSLERGGGGGDDYDANGRFCSADGQHGRGHTNYATIDSLRMPKRADSVVLEIIATESESDSVGRM